MALTGAEKDKTASTSAQSVFPLLLKSELLDSLVLPVFDEKTAMIK